MSLLLPNRYPGRFDPTSVDYPQGKFKNRTAPGAKDGSYLERDWANDQLAFFGALLNNAGIVPDGSVDTAQVSQLYDALVAVVGGTTETAFKTYGLGVETGESVQLSDFNNTSLPTGMYRALGAGNASATPNAPPQSGDAVLGVLAIQVNGAVQYIVKENGATISTQRMYVGNSFDGVSVQWDEVSTSSKFTSSKTSSGWQYINGGLILQWGTAAQNAATVTFPLTFPNTCLMVSRTFKDVTTTSAFDPGYLSTTAWTASGFTQQNANTVLGGTRPWFAIGH